MLFIIYNQCSATTVLGDMCDKLLSTYVANFNVESVLCKNERQREKDVRGQVISRHFFSI